MSNGRITDQIKELHAHLRATQALPVERTASLWIGEAEVIAADLVTADVTIDVHHNRLSHIRDLLSNVEETEHPAANNHVAAARQITSELLDKINSC